MIQGSTNVEKKNIVEDSREVTLNETRDKSRVVDQQFDCTLIMLHQA